MLNPHPSFAARSWTTGPSGLRAVLEGPDDGNGAPAGSGPSANAGDKVAAAKASAERVEIPGQRERVEGRRNAQNAVGRHAMIKAYNDLHARNQAAKPEVEPGAQKPAPSAKPVPVKLTPAQQAQRDERGRFAAKQAEEQAAQGAADVEGRAPDAVENAEAELPPQVLERVQAAELKLTEGAKAARAEIQKITGERDSVTDERDLYKGLFERLRSAVKQQYKVDVDPVELRLAMQGLELARAKRETGGFKQQETAARTAELSTQIESRVRAVITAHGLDPTHPEVQTFLRAYLDTPPGMPPIPLERLEADAPAFAMVLRGRQLAAAGVTEKPATTAPAARKRPDAMIPAGQGASQGGAVQAKRGDHVSRRSIEQHMQQFRAIRGGRG